MQDQHRFNTKAWLLWTVITFMALSGILLDRLRATTPAVPPLHPARDQATAH